MVKLLLGTMALVGVLGFVACNGGGTQPPPGGLTDCPTTPITTSSSNLYSVPSCQLKVGSSVTIEASSNHPMIAKGSTPLVPSEQTSNVVYLVKTEDVGKTLEFQCKFHGSSGMTGSIKVIAAM
jgi:hypothetical protein